MGLSWAGKGLSACAWFAIAGAVVATAQSTKVYQATAISVGPSNVPSLHESAREAAARQTRKQ